MAGGTPSNGGYTVKESLQRIEDKVDGVSNDVGDLTTAVTVHTANKHIDKVDELWDEKTREQGRRDVLRYIFGVSLVALVTGLGGLIISVYRAFNP